MRGGDDAEAKPTTTVRGRAPHSRSDELLLSLLTAVVGAERAEACEAASGVGAGAAGVAGDAAVGGELLTEILDMCALKDRHDNDAG